MTCLWCLLQVASAVPGTFHHPIWQMTGEVLGQQIAGSISVNRDATIAALLRLATAGSALWLALQLCRSPRRAQRLVEAIAVIGFAYAAYGLVAFFAFPNTILWFYKLHYVGSVTSTFVNRNSYATYAAIGLICAMAMAISEFLQGSARTSRSIKHQIAAIIATSVGHGGAWLAAAGVIGAAWTMTGSRGGIASGSMGLLFGLLLAALSRRRQREHGGSAATVAVACACLTVLTAIFAFGDILAGRLLSEGLRSDDRLAIYTMTLRSIADRPLMGSGYGTFEQIFPMYREANVSPMGVWDRAHNTYLELLQGLGLPVALMLFAGVAVLIVRCIAAALNRRRSIMAPLAAAAASVAVLLHAFVDFSLQCQAVALTWAVLCGAGVAQSWSSSTETGGDEHTRLVPPIQQGPQSRYHLSLRILC